MKPESNYSVEFAPSGEKDLDKLTPETLSRVEKAIDRLQTTPHPRGARKLQGCENAYRIRVGDWRIIYEIEDSVRNIVVTRVRHRSKVYD